MDKAFKLNFQGVLHHSAILTSFALLFAFFNFFNMGDPIFESIVYEIITFHIIGFSIIILLDISNVFALKNSFKKGILLLALFVVGGWTGNILRYVVFKYLLRYTFEPGWLKDSIISISFFSVFFSLIITVYNTLREKLHQTVAKLSEKELAEQEMLRLKTKAELEALRAKVNPHFLFNTLNSIAGLIPQDPEKADTLVLKLSDLFRYTLDASMHNLIKLPEEMHIVKEYLDIEKIRFGDRLRYSIDMDVRLSDQMIPGLLLQPLVENSIKHGISHTPGGGEITIRCFIHDEYCTIEIADTCGEYEPSSTEHGFGLFGVRERLDLLYGEQHELNIISDNGVTVRIRLPLTKGKSGQ